MKRDLLTLEDFSREEIDHLFELTKFLKQEKGKVRDDLKRKTIGLVFQKPSNRTRVSFEVGIWQLGGNCIYLGPDEINLGRRESTSDVAKTLSRYLDAIVARTNSHDDIVKLGREATIPVINGLSDQFHPCQALADIFSIIEKLGSVKGLTLAYIGDGNNVCHSLLLGSARVGLNMNVASPKGYEPNAQVAQKALSLAKTSGAEINLGNSPEEAAKGANIIYSDVFVSMGQEKERTARLKKFKKFQVNKKITHLADKNYIYMHCLPAHRGEEVIADIIDGIHSIVFDQAENRLHVQKAILLFLLAKKIGAHE